MNLNAKRPRPTATGLLALYGTQLAAYNGTPGSTIVQQSTQHSTAQDSTPQSAPSALDGYWWLLISVGVYFFPTIIAFRRDHGRHHNAAAICALNLLLGWTVIGWIAALVWALTNPAPRANAPST